MVAAESIEKLSHVTDFKTHFAIQFISQSGVQAVPVEHHLVVIEENLVVGGEVKSFIRKVFVVKGQIERQEVAKAQTKVLSLNPSLFKSVAVLPPYPAELLKGNKLLVYSMLIDAEFLLHDIDIVTAVDEGISKEQIVVVFA